MNMPVTQVNTTVCQNSNAISRNEYITSNTTLDLLNPLYPTANLTQTDVDAIISDLCDEIDANWQEQQNPGLLDVINVEYHDELGHGQQTTRIWTDMTAYNNMQAKYPILFDNRLYTLDGINLIKVSDGSVESVLNPKEYARWQWIFYAQIVTVRGEVVVT
jgi:hypothetical protein